MDYELLGQTRTGLDVIEELQLQKSSILVTSYYEERKIRDRCTNLGVKLLPKGMLGFVPISIKESEAYFDAILIDDDRLIRSVWESSAKKMGLQVKTFVDPMNFSRSQGRLTVKPVFMWMHI